MKKKESKEQKKIKELEKKVAINLSGWQKALADYQNLEKESNKQVAELSNYLKSNIILQLLPIFDNYRTAIDHIPEDQKESQWAVGLEHILKMWESFLEINNIEKIESLGKEFDIDLHQSIGEINDKEKKDQEILEEKESGYSIDNNIIRPSKVIINNLD